MELYFMPDRPAHALSLRPSALKTALTSLAAMVQERLRLDPFGGAAFRDRRAGRADRLSCCSGTAGARTADCIGGGTRRHGRPAGLFQSVSMLLTRAWERSEKEAASNSPTRNPHA